MTDHSSDEWTAEERAQLADIGRHRSPRAELKGRTMSALRDRGMLGAADQRRRPPRFALGLAAAAVVFAAGMLAGYGIGLRRQPEGRRDSVTSGGASVTREVARLDTASMPTARHVVWF
jgi:hypothetical protein